MKRSVLVLLLACDASGAAYLYSGNLWEPPRGCIDPTSIIDVAEGTDPGAGCAAKCLAASDGGLPVYVTTMCGSPPIVANVSGSNPACAPALAAFARGDFCLDGGGSANPLDAQNDVSSDAVSEGSTD